jgi:formylglycine-generating enzyme
VRAFLVDQYEVTKALWDEVYSWAITNQYSLDNAGRGKGTNHPVHTVSWYDVVKWCNARSEKEGRVPAYYTDATQKTVYRTGKVDLQNDWVEWDWGYGLPTEAEWEKAARGGLSGRRFPWGDTVSWSNANYYAYPVSAGGYPYDVNAKEGSDPTYAVGDAPYTSPVGSLSANACGLYDMAGNMWEWCWDSFGSYSSDAQVDPRGPAPGYYRVLRGGAWSDFALQCRVSFRWSQGSGTRYNYYGFRSVLPSE